MKLKSLDFPDMETYKLRFRNGVSLLVTFDHAYPEMGWRASYQKPHDRQTHHMDAPFVDKLTAMQRVEEQARA